VPEALTAAVAAEVRRLIDERRWTGRELARRTGMSPTSMAMKLRGDARLDFDDLTLIAKECDVTVAFIVARAEAAVAHPSE
jgi:transcriptional regulator with XRE-family HTH domain